MSRNLTALLLGCMLMSATASGAAAGPVAQSPAEQIAPGIWRIRLGDPEPFTPLHFRSGPVRIDALGRLSAIQTPPIDVTNFAFAVSSRGCSVSIPRNSDERIYGLGLNTRLFELTNRRAFIVPSDHPEQDTNESHAPAPFYVSSRGYGVYVDTARFASFYIGSVDPTSAAATEPGSDGSAAPSADALYRSRYLPKQTVMVDIPAARGVDVYFFAGPTMLDAVRRYNLFSGGGAVPPLWGLGIAYRGQSKLTAAQTLSLAKQFRDDHIPCDQWGLENGWLSRSYSCSFSWDTANFPDPDGFIRQMHQLGYRLSFWEHAFTNPVSPIYQALRPWSGNYRVWNGLVPDFATSQARKIFLDHHEKLLFARGADAMKLDECDYQPFRSNRVWSFPEASSFPSGLDGEQMHSLFGLLYQQTMLEPFARRNLRTWGLCRNSGALAAPLPYVIYSDSYDQQCYIRGLAKCGFCGLLWVPEVRDAQTLGDLYRRVETVIYSPYAMLNCWYMPMPPWMQIDRERNQLGQVMPEHPQAAETIRRLFGLRMSLIPYLYSAFNEYRLAGTPPIRALVLDYPDDARVAGIDDQFMFGPSLMVAPLLSDQVGREVYLPAGDWYDFWTHQKYTGVRAIYVLKPLDQIPVFVKAGSLLPIARPVEHVTPDTCFDLTVAAFGNNPATFTLFEDDGITNDYAQGKQNQIELNWDGKRGTVHKSGDYAGPPRYSVSGWTSVEGK